MASSLKKVAVLGTGSIGMRHLSTLRHVANAEPIAVPKRFERIPVLKNLGFNVAKSLQEAFQMGASQAVIATDTASHTVDSLSALEMGFDLLVEKPLAVDAESALPLHTAAQKKNRNVFVGCVLRFSESLNHFRNLLPQLGSIYSVDIECRSYLPDWRPDRPYQQSYSARAADGGVLRDLIHEIDYAGWIFGWPKSVSAKLKNLGVLSIEAEEMADLSWETVNGAFVSIALDYLARPPKRTMTAYGREGTLEWNGIEGTVTLELAGQEKQIFKSHQTKEQMYLEQMKAFLNPQHSSPLATAVEGIKALAVCDAARLASQTKKEETISYLI